MNSARLLNVTFCLSILQIYTFPIGTLYVPLYVLASFTLFAAFALKLQLWNSYTRPLLVLLGIEILSLLWSPDKVLGFRNILYSTPFVILFCVSLFVALQSERTLVSSVKIFSLFCIAHSCLVILFRVSPSVEASFLASSLARFFINPNLIEMYSYDFNNNVNDPTKAGGFFLNANTGAVFSELAAYLTIAVSIYGRRVFWTIVALVHFGAVVASGSKSALVLLAAAPVLTWFFLQFTAQRMTSQRTIVLLVIMALVAVVGAVAYDWFQRSDIGADAAINAERREVIWNFAIDQFWKSPFVGQGYGGWALSFGSYGYAWRDIGINEQMPAHNSLIILWSESGLLAALAGVWLICKFLKNSHRSTKLPGGLLTSGAAICALFSVFVHSLGDNFSLIGELHIQAPLAILMGWMAARAETVRVNGLQRRSVAPSKMIEQTYGRKMAIGTMRVAK